MKTAQTARPAFGKKPAPAAARPLTTREMAAMAEAREWIGRAAELDMNHIRQIAAR